MGRGIFFLGAFLALAVAQDSLKLDPETKTLVDDLLGSRVTNEDAAEHVFFAGALPAAAERAVAVPVPGDNTGLYIGLTLIPFVLGAVAFVVCLLVFRKQNKAAEGGYQAAMSRGQVIALVAVAVVTSLATLAVGLGLFLGAARSGAVAPAAASTNARAAMEKPSDSAGWLEWLNYYRLAGGSTAVTEERSWSSGILKHLAYLSGTPAAQRAGFSDHSENPSSPLYSKEGAEAGSSSDLGGPGVTSDKDAIEGWLKAPFHGMLMMSTRSVRQAYARSADGRVGIDVLRGISNSAPRQQRPIFFPPHGSCQSRGGAGELPDNTEGCSADWRNNRWRGAPSWVAFPSPVVETGLSAKIFLSDGTIWSTAAGTLCMQTPGSFRSTDPLYGAAGMAALKAANGVVLIPRASYPGDVFVTATISQAGRPDLVWSWYVLPETRRSCGSSGCTTIGGGPCKQIPAGASPTWIPEVVTDAPTFPPRPVGGTGGGTGGTGGGGSQPWLEEEKQTPTPNQCVRSAVNKRLVVGGAVTGVAAAGSVFTAIRNDGGWMWGTDCSGSSFYIAASFLAPCSKMCSSAASSSPAVSPTSSSNVRCATAATTRRSSATARTQPVARGTAFRVLGPAGKDSRVTDCASGQTWLVPTAALSPCTAQCAR